MRIVFMGTPEFGARSLERLYSDGHDVAGVFTQPDKQGGRGMKQIVCPVKALAQKHGTQVFQPATLKDGEAAGVLQELCCELIVVVAYGKMLPRIVLDLPPLGCVNIHGSLLPKYRGAAPIQWAVINGERETGVTSQFMSEEMDAGDIIIAKKTGIGEDETAGELYNRLSVMGADVLSETIDAIAGNRAVRQPQDHSIATFAPSLKKDISPIDWTQTPLMIKAKVRGLNPWPVATAQLGGIVFKVFSVDTSETQTGKAPGEVLSAGADGIAVACRGGIVTIRDLQAPGGRLMKAADYIRGHGDHFSAL